MGLWWKFAFVMLAIVTPILLIVDEQKASNMPLNILLLPTTLAWFFLMTTICQLNCRITRYFKVVTTLHQSVRSYQHMSKIMNSPEGRNTKHCKLYTRAEFQVRFLKFLIWSLLSFWLGIFIKVYIADFFPKVHMKWIHASALSFVPIFIIYSREIILESCKSQKNLTEKTQMFSNFMSLAINKAYSDSQIMVELKGKHDFSNLQLQGMTDKKEENPQNPLLKSHTSL